MACGCKGGSRQIAYSLERPDGSEELYGRLEDAREARKDAGGGTIRAIRT